MKVVGNFMSRAREAIRADIFQLDPHEQALLAEEITEHLSKDENMKLWLEEAKRAKQQSTDPALNDRL